MHYFKFSYVLSLVLLIFGSTSAFSQVSIPINKLDSYMEKTPKPVVFFFHTDWCTYCAMQSKQITKDATFKKTLDKQFYFVDFNAESDDTVYFNGKSYGNFKQHKFSTHNLVKHFFADNKTVSYPAWVITDKNYNVIFRHQGLLKAEKLKKILSLVVKD